jgi:transposase
MEGEKVLMSQRQLHRFRVVGFVESGRITLKEAAAKMGVSYRQAKRIWKRVRGKGAQGLLHGNAGRSPQHRIPDSLRKRIVELSCQKDALAARTPGSDQIFLPAV